jgi:G3E family GTPase
VVLNKIDLIDEKAQINASQIIQKIAPWVRLLKGSYGDVSLDLLLGFRDSFPVRSVSSQLKSNHSDNFHTWSYESVRPFQLLTLGKILGKLPVTVWRAKGILSTVEHPNRGVILQQVGPRITLEIGEEWGNNPPFTQLVLISTEAINTKILQQQLDSCLRVEDFEVNLKTQTKDNFILSNEM